MVLESPPKKSLFIQKDKCWTDSLITQSIFNSGYVSNKDIFDWNLFHLTDMSQAVAALD